MSKRWHWWGAALWCWESNSRSRAAMSAFLVNKKVHYLLCPPARVSPLLKKTVSAHMECLPGYGSRSGCSTGRAAANQRAFPSSAEPTRRQPKPSPRLTRPPAAVGTSDSGTQRKGIILRLKLGKGGIAYDGVWRRHRVSSATFTAGAEPGSQASLPLPACFQTLNLDVKDQTAALSTYLDPSLGIGRSARNMTRSEN